MLKSSSRCDYETLHSVECVSHGLAESPTAVRYRRLRRQCKSQQLQNTSWHLVKSLRQKITADAHIHHQGRNAGTRLSSRRLKAASDGTQPSLGSQSAAASSPAFESSPYKDRLTKISTIVAGVLALAGVLLYRNGSLNSIKASANQSVLGRSGFLAAFSLIFISEIGDKTFFIAGLLAAKVGRWRSLIGSSAALGLMTLISVAIGSAFKSLPDVLKSSLPVGQYLGAALMLLFGVRTIKEAWQTADEGRDGDGELHEAQESVSTAEKDWDQKGGLWRVLLQVGTLIFLAEWGDRSMLATIALGASHPSYGVAIGATLAHVAATLIAVVSGSIASQYVSEKTIGYTGGGLFLLFAVLTFFGCF